MCALSERVNLRVVGLLVLAGNVHYTGRKRGEDETWISYIGLPASNDQICSHQIYVGTFKVTQPNNYVLYVAKQCRWTIYHY